MNDLIVTSILDDDLYKLTMGAVVFHDFPYAKARYKFINRGKTQFPVGFAKALRLQLFELGWVRLTKQEGLYLNNLSLLKPTYIDWLSGYKYDTDEVKVNQIGGDLSIVVEGYWYRTILWEVKLMAIISELYFRMTGTKLAEDWVERIEYKAKELSDNGCLWSDFGTRRRRSKAVQSQVVEVMRNYKGFIGTSNVHLAMDYGITPIGTSAHEAVMAMAVYYNYQSANSEWCRHWRGYYGDKLSIALTDTFTTDVFLRKWTSYDAHAWDGLRQDSGDPDVWAKKIIQVYRTLGVSEMGLKQKKFVFSDNLNIYKAIGLNAKYRDVVTPIFGIGTNLTNDTFTNEDYNLGIKPLNMVIKLTEVNFGHGWIDTVKLSDDVGKNTGPNETIERVKSLLNITTI